MSPACTLAAEEKPHDRKQHGQPGGHPTPAGKTPTQGRCGPSGGRDAWPESRRRSGTGKRACNSAMLDSAGSSAAPKEIIPRPTIEVAAVTRALPRIARVARGGAGGGGNGSAARDRLAVPRRAPSSAARSTAWACCKSCFNCSAACWAAWTSAATGASGGKRWAATRHGGSAPGRSWAESRPSRDARP